MSLAFCNTKGGIIRCLLQRRRRIGHRLFRFSSIRKLGGSDTFGRGLNEGSDEQTQEYCRSDSNFVSGGQTVNDTSKIPDGLARRDKSFSTTVETQFQVQGICVHFMGNSPGDRL